MPLFSSRLRASRDVDAELEEAETLMEGMHGELEGARGDVQDLQRQVAVLHAQVADCSGRPEDLSQLTEALIEAHQEIRSLRELIQAAASPVASSPATDLIAFCVFQ